MKVYFAGSIRGGRQDAELYRKVIAALKEKHQVLTEHVGDLSLSTVEDKGDTAIYEQDTAWLRECDVVDAPDYVFPFSVAGVQATPIAYGNRSFFLTQRRCRKCHPTKIKISIAE